VAHPHGHALVRFEAVEESSDLFDLELRSSVLTLAGIDHVAARKMRDELHAVADGEHRSDIEQLRWRRWSAILVHGVGPAAQNDAGGIPLADPRDAARRRMDLGIHARFADAARDELCELRAVVDDEDSGRHEIRTSIAVHSE